MSAGDVKYFQVMVDRNHDGQITYAEFLEVSRWKVLLCKLRFKLRKRAVCTKTLYLLSRPAGSAPTQAARSSRAEEQAARERSIDARTALQLVSEYIRTSGVRA